ncbi:hypothetical protein SAMN05216247_103549 [Pseudomonas salomonii]|uniref:Uncharacterized protein n=1 Tax=Pseudomonas salomonii TaxID=191391 RepID=A0A1H3JDS2_9PSED|nr:hypothetical protein SAMN05216247_103549 [Pseudomonas salomonii]
MQNKTHTPAYNHHLQPQSILAPNSKNPCEYNEKLYFLLRALQKETIVHLRLRL